MYHELIADYRRRVGEGPMWHPIEKCVYWLDIPAGRLFRHDPAAKSHRLYFEGPQIGGFTLQTDGSLLLFTEKGAIATLRSGSLEYLFDEIPAERGTRFNYVIADPAGRVFCGSLYRLDTDGSIRQVLSGIGISNGLGLTPDKKQMYHTDSPAHNVYIFDYDSVSGELSNQRVFVNTGDNDGIPDGMTVDADGYVWSSRWDGSSLVRYSPRRESRPASLVPRT